MNEQQIFISEQLELQVDSLNELKYKKVFANEEIAKIVQKRTDYLYLLASSLPKEDLLHPYLSHMLFELNLLQLIKTRLKLNKKKNNDFNIHLQFPYNQYKIGIAKFSTQIYLMKSYIDFCMQYQLKPNSAFDQVLSKHSNQEQLWLLYSKFEFEYNQAIDSGIQILKNGIKAIPHTSQYLHLELLKLYLIKAEYAEFRMLFNSVLENLNNVEYGYFFEIIKLLMFYYREELTKNDEEQDDMSDDEEPTSTEKHEFFTEMIEFILEKVLLKNYRNDEKCLYEIFKFKLTYFNNNTDYEELISNMENICDRICHTSKMYHYYMLLLIDIFNITKKVEYINRIHSVFGKMNTFNLLTFRTILIYSNILLSIEDNSQQVVKVLKQLHLINSNHSSDFFKCLLLLLDLTKYSRDSIDYSVKLVNEKSADNEFKIQFYEQLFTNISKSVSQEQLQHLYLDGIKNTGNSHEIKKLYFKHIIDNVAQGDYQKLDKYVKLILSLPPNSHQVYQMMITYITKHLTGLESASCGNYHSLLGYLYEQQMVENRHDWKVYIQYMQYLKKQNRLKNISSVYQKAVNALSGKSEELSAFVQHYDKYVK